MRAVFNGCISKDVDWMSQHLTRTKVLWGVKQNVIQLRLYTHINYDMIPYNKVYLCHNYVRSKADEMAIVFYVLILY